MEQQKLTNQTKTEKTDNNPNPFDNLQHKAPSNFASGAVFHGPRSVMVWDLSRGISLSTLGEKESSAETENRPWD